VIISIFQLSSKLFLACVLFLNHPSTMSSFLQLSLGQLPRSELPAWPSSHSEILARFRNFECYFMSADWDRPVKLLVLGDTDVGKTALINRFVTGEFSAECQATIGTNFAFKELEISGKSVTLQIWDTAGQARFHSLGPAFYRGTDCCALVYDVTRPSTFESIATWRSDFLAALNLADADAFPFVLLANKGDLPNKAVGSSANTEVLFFQVSAMTGENVQEAFEAIVRRTLDPPAPVVEPPPPVVQPPAPVVQPPPPVVQPPPPVVQPPRVIIHPPPDPCF
jgi:Ras-related protein Rab-7A